MMPYAAGQRTGPNRRTDGAFTLPSRTSNRSQLHVPGLFYECTEKLDTQSGTEVQPSKPCHPQNDQRTLLNISTGRRFWMFLLTERNARFQGSKIDVECGTWIDSYAIPRTLSGFGFWTSGPQDLLISGPLDLRTSGPQDLWTSIHAVRFQVPSSTFQVGTRHQANSGVKP